MTTILDFPRIPPVDTDGMELPVGRKFMTRVASFINSVAEDANSPQWRRDDALVLFNEVSEQLSYTEGVDGRRECPFWMCWSEVAQVECESFVDKLPPGVAAENPIYIEMAHRMAKLVDNHGFATDFRYEALAQLNKIVNRLKKLANDDSEEGVAND
jgi:hypothetical protein